MIWTETLQIADTGHTLGSGSSRCPPAWYPGHYMRKRQPKASTRLLWEGTSDLVPSWASKHSGQLA